MNQEQIRHALSLHNPTQVTEATKIAPTTLQRIIDGNHIPDPDQIDALAGYFAGEYYLSGVDFNWTRRRKPESTVLTLPIACEHVPGPDIKYDPFGPPPDLKPGPNPTGTGAIEDGITGVGNKVRT